MKREELFDLLCDENYKYNEAFDKILSQINIKEDAKDFFELSEEVHRLYLSIDFINYLTKSGNIKVLEENIQYIHSKCWNFLKENEEFKRTFLNNFDKIAENNKYIDFFDIREIIDKDKEENFYKNNILNLIDIIKRGMELFINHLINNTNFGEELLVQNQVYLFRNLQYTYSLLKSLKNTLGIDTKIFLKGIAENFRYITQKEKVHFCQFLNIVKDMTEESDLEKKEIEDIKEKIRTTIVNGQKLNEELVEEIIKENDDKTVENIRYFGVDKQILRNYQDMFLNTFIGQNIIGYMNGCKKYEGIPKDYILKKLLPQVFYSNSRIVNDKPTMNAIEILITEIAKKQGLEPLDIENAGKGNYSTNFKIGEFILKVGKTREARRIPYHKRIMQPIIRQETNPGNIDNFCIELQNVGGY